MKTKIQKWGNSLAIRLPIALTSHSSLYEGSGVLVKTQGRNIVIEPVDSAKEISLKDMVSKITPSNRYKAVDWGKPVGKEVW